MKRAQDFKAGNPVKGGTIYLTAADENGMMVSFIQSNYMGFGSGCVEPTFGISLQNRGHGFSHRPGRPGAEPGGAGQAAVPHHHPGLPHQGRPAGDELRRDGRQHAAAGPHADAGAHARLRAEPAGRLRRTALALQRGAGDQRRGSRWPATVQGLPSRGHRMEVINDNYQDFGAGQFIWRWATRRSRATWWPAIRAATAWRQGRRATRPQVLGMVVSYAGVLLVFGHELWTGGGGKGGGAAAWGAFLVFLSAVSYAGYLVYSGEFVKRLGSLRLVGLATTVACVLCILQFVLTRPISVACSWHRRSSGSRCSTPRCARRCLS
jgi:hypothetical protein